MRTRAVMVTETQDVYLIRQAQRAKSSVSWIVRRMIDQAMSGDIGSSDNDPTDNEASTGEMEVSE